MPVSATVLVYGARSALNVSQSVPLLHSLRQQQQCQSLRNNDDALTATRVGSFRLIHTYAQIQDAIHGIIYLPSYIQEITQQSDFQRLKKVFQLGLLPLSVKPGANHTRFEHCIGTFKSAQDQLNALLRNSNYEYELPDWCRKSVEIAALLHDIGHGPFSHTWEHVCEGQFNHEKNSEACVDRVFSDARDDELVALRDDHNGRGVNLIKALILGDRSKLNYVMMHHAYIFDIVHNKVCGLDVDKWDYLRRDNHYLQVLSADEMDFDEIFLNARIAPDGQRIEYRYEDYHKIWLLYLARHRLHLEAYQLPKVLLCNDIFGEIVRRQQPHLLDVNAESDPEEWLRLNDERVLEQITNDTETQYLRATERIEEANEGRLVRRRISGPGEDMNSNKVYAFYGNPSLRRDIFLQENQQQSTIIEKYFKLK
ncbi:deoxynucleoside triphosphate triphosphohydrolase SAMHD1 homolog isoform X1 [Scaptodrosophila lebanonensis]|uniref:Deoxynucleoside triphosphate triphosphohydrolase SAMHD1 homolog isoform X1 n=1 Tax=Drosophila lebanonensis TaxID=7225 RepID=A0A6J2UHX3_DROLE|nr:deoxynucleoside triphosphate triphosphohydrolase SAMHD1 homolog isoform X1 [Scaptodrosophila lebanonensis]